MKLDVPFIPDDSDGNQCAQGCLRMVASYHDKTIASWAEADELCDRRPNEWTWPYQVINALLKLELHVEYHTATDPEKYLGGVPAWEEIFGKEATQTILKHTNVEAVINAIKKMKDKGVTTVDTPSEEDLIGWLDEGAPIIVNINWNVVTEKEDTYQGHTLVLTGYDDEHFYAHHTGPGDPQAHLPIKKETLLRASRTPQTDNDTIVVRN